MHDPQFPISRGILVAPGIQTQPHWEQNGTEDTVVT